MKKILSVFLFSTLIISTFNSCKKDIIKPIEGEALIDGEYLFDPTNSGGRIELIGDQFVTLELGNTYTEQGAFIVDTNKVLDNDGNLVDSFLNLKPIITPDFTTEGIKSVVYFFYNSKHQECSIVRYVVVYKKPTSAPTSDISGTYKYGASALNVVTKVTDGVYYMSNVLNQTSAYRRGVPALFYQTTDSTFDIINQYFSKTISTYEYDFYGMLQEDRDLAISGSNEKIIYSTTAPLIQLQYRVYPNTSQISFGAFGATTSSTIKNTLYKINLQ